jgi:hypothetical protein
VLVSHIAWWSRKAYFPNQELCEDAHDRFHLSRKEKDGLGREGEEVAKEGQDGEAAKPLPKPKNYDELKKKAEARLWHSIAWNLISRVPEGLSISGFFCALIWPVFVLLNVLLLAQVMGVIVGEGGGVVDIHPFGSYGAIPLVSAVLYAVAQSVFGIMFGEAEKKDKKRYLVLTLLVLAILLEGGLAVYRAWLIRGGDATAGPNLIDNSLAGRFGLVVGAFFGIFFPATHAALGYVGFPQFVRPIFRYVLQLAGGVSALAVAFGNYFLLAWHPVHPRDFDRPRDGTSSDRKASDLKRTEQERIDTERIEKEKAEKEQAEKELAEKERIEKERADQAKIDKMKAELTPEENHYWIQQVKLVDTANELSGRLASLYARLPVTPAEVEDTIREKNELKQRWSQIAIKAKKLVASASRLDADQIALMVSKLDESRPRFEAPRPTYENQEDLHREAILKDAIRRGKSRLGPLYEVANSHDMLQSAVEEITQLEYELYKEGNLKGQEILDKAKRLQSNFPELERQLKEEKKERSDLGQDMDFNLCKVDTERLISNFAAIPAPETGNPRVWDYERLVPLYDKCKTLYKGLEEKKSASMSVRTNAGLKDLKRKLEAISKELPRAYAAALRSLKDAEKMANERLKRVEGRPGWFYRLGDLLA